MRALIGLYMSLQVWWWQRQWDVALLNAKWAFVQAGDEHMSDEDWSRFINGLTFRQFLCLMCLGEPAEEDKPPEEERPMTRAERIAEHRLRQPLDELRRKAAKARSPGFWSQEEIDLARREARELSAALAECPTE